MLVEPLAERVATLAQPAPDRLEIEGLGIVPA